jgi:phosphoglycerol transferase MdoB-like AlkP superfamily enzyme
MRNFFTGNGFEHIIDFNDIKNPQFVGSWGDSDEDLFNHAHSRLLELSQKNQPFFSLIFSSSNHAPFEFPDGKIELHEQPKATVNNAVKYADYALGRFIKNAQASDYWQNTLFLIVADHDNRVYGDTLVPINKFHIPSLILGADIQPRDISHVASQIDLAPTLLSLMGISGQHPMLGRDFAADNLSLGRALIQFEDYFALMQEEVAEEKKSEYKLTILKPDKTVVAATYEPKQQQVTLLTDVVDKEEREKALAHVLLPSILYREQLYRIKE